MRASAGHVAEPLRGSVYRCFAPQISLGEPDLRGGDQRDASKFSSIEFAASGEIDFFAGGEARKEIFNFDGGN